MVSGLIPGRYIIDCPPKENLSRSPRYLILFPQTPIVEFGLSIYATFSAILLVSRD